MKKIKNFLPILFTLILLLLSLTACSNQAKTPKTEVQSTTYPISYTDGFGDTSVVSKEPERIVSLSPNITEVLCSLGLEDKIVGRTNYCDYPESVKSIETVGELATPSTEKIVELKPDVVITDGMQAKEFVIGLRELGLTVVCLRQNQTIDGTYQILKDSGLITNKNDKAEEIVSNMENAIEKAEEELKGIEEKKTVFYAVDFGDYGLYTSGKGTYIDELFTKAGLVNIAADSEGWTYSLEKLYENNPDIIICSKYYGTKDKLMSYTPFKDLDAVKNGQVVEIDNNQLDRQTARNADAIKELVKAIYDIEI